MDPSAGSLGVEISKFSSPETDPRDNEEIRPELDVHEPVIDSTGGNDGAD